jgi:hypothetical protein
VTQFESRIVQLVNACGGMARSDFAELLLTPGALDLGVDLLPQLAARPILGDGKSLQKIGLAEPVRDGAGRFGPSADVDPSLAALSRRPAGGH